MATKAHKGPYTPIKTLGQIRPGVRRHMTHHGQQIFRAAFDAATHSSIGKRDPSYPWKVANAAVARAGARRAGKDAGTGARS